MHTSRFGLQCVMMNIKHELEWKPFDLLHVVLSVILHERVIPSVENTFCASIFIVVIVEHESFCFKIFFLPEPFRQKKWLNIDCTFRGIVL